jgi:hypothetical protein
MVARRFTSAWVEADITDNSPLRRFAATWVEADISYIEPHRRFTSAWIEADVTLKIHISDVTPTGGLPGTAVTITGFGFGDTQGSGTVAFNGTPATTITSWSDTEIVCEVPVGATTGNVVVTENGGLSSAGVAFVVGTVPSITSLSPTSGAGGKTVTLTGTGFIADQGSGTVAFGETESTVTSWSDTQVVCSVPEGLEPGALLVTLTNSDGLSDTEPFEVKAVTRKRRTRLNLILLVGN